MFTKITKAIVTAFFILSLNACATNGSIDKIWAQLGVNATTNDSQNIKLTRLEQNVIELSFPDELLFKFGSTKLTHQAKKDLTKLSKILRQYPGIKIYINGYTDSTGSKSFNQNLSEKRAKAVSDLLFETGIQKEQLTAKGYGESKPVTTNYTVAGRRENRRVEISLYEENSTGPRAMLKRKE